MDSERLRTVVRDFSAYSRVGQVAQSSGRLLSPLSVSGVWQAAVLAPALEWLALLIPLDART